MLLSNDNNSTDHCIHDDNLEDKVIKYVAMVACILSSIGSFIIILSYILIRPIRTKVREILVHLSVMDLTYSLANLIGLILNYDAHLDESCDLTHPYDVICKVQGGFAFYATISSILWTSGIAIYLYFRVVINKDGVMCIVLMLLYITCWGIPAVLTVWVLLVDAIGYDGHQSSGGWCALEQKSQSTHTGNIVIAIFNNDLWIILTIILVVMLYGIIHCHIRRQVCNVLCNHRVFMCIMIFAAIVFKLQYCDIVFK